MLPPGKVPVRPKANHELRLQDDDAKNLALSERGGDPGLSIQPARDSPAVVYEPAVIQVDSQHRNESEKDDAQVDLGHGAFLKTDPMASFSERTTAGSEPSAKGAGWP